MLQKAALLFQSDISFNGKVLQRLLKNFKTHKESAEAHSLIRLIEDGILENTLAYELAGNLSTGLFPLFFPFFLFYSVFPVFFSLLSVAAVVLHICFCIFAALAGINGARSAIINNNLSDLMLDLNAVVIAIALPSFFAGLFSSLVLFLPFHSIAHESHLSAHHSFVSLELFKIGVGGMSEFSRMIGYDADFGSGGALGYALFLLCMIVISILTYLFVKRMYRL